MAPTTKAATKATKAPAKTAKKAASAAGGTKKAGLVAKASKSASASKNGSRKTAPAKKAVAKKEPVKKAVAAKAPAKKPVPPAKKVVAKKSVARKPVASDGAAQARAKPVGAKKSASRGTIPALAKRVPSDNDRKPPPKRTGPLDKFLLDQLADLNEERITYTRQAASLKAEADLLVAEREPGDVQFDEESGEGDTLAVERERDLALSASAQNAVEDIDRAIAKIHDGTYGVCEQCYAKIPKERLRALPYAALCVQCKSAGFSRR